MKHKTGKLLSILLALVMVTGMLIPAATVFATGDDDAAVVVDAATEELHETAAPAARFGTTAAEDVNVRETPEVESDIVTVLAEVGTQVAVKQVVSNDDAIWYLIETVDDETGYVSADLVEYTMDEDEEIVVYEAPAAAVETADTTEEEPAEIASEEDETANASEEEPAEIASEEDETANASGEEVLNQVAPPSAIRRAPAAATPNAAGYIDISGNGSVYMGGQARSNGDSDPNDFALVLPYGNIYVDPAKLTFANSVVDIKDTNNFTIVAEDLNKQDLNGTNPTMAVGFAQGSAVNMQPWLKGSIAYIGGLDAYLEGTPEYQTWVNNGSSTTNYSYLNATSDNGTTKRIVADDNDYLYSFTFKDAAILPDGSDGKVVIKTTAIEMESAIDVLPGVPIGIQCPNHIGINPVYKPAGSPTSQRYIPPTVKVGNKNIATALGLKVTFDIQVLDAGGNPVNGTFSYSVNDLDMTSKQSLWGRPSADENADASYMYAEGFEIQSGAKSYAVIPNYNHDDVEHPLRVTVDTAKAAGVANGAKFTSSAFLNKRVDGVLQQGTNEIRPDNATFDTGFAVLLDASGSTVAWSGSHWANGQMNTQIFDTSVYTYVEQSHGPGGSLWVADYTTMDSVTHPAMTSKTVTFGWYTSPKLVATPEYGYRVTTIKIENAEGAANPKTYTVVYNGDGKAIAINDGSSDIFLDSNGEVTINSIQFKANDSGSVDIIVPDITVAQHIHTEYTPDPRPVLKVEKTVTGNAGETDRGFAFTVKVWKDDEYLDLSSYGGSDNGDHTYIFTLKHGQSLSLKVPTGYQYQVSEEDCSGDGYATKVDNVEGRVASDTMPAKNDLTDGTKTVGFENSRYGLTVSKTVSGNMGSKSQYFQFTIAVNNTGLASGSTVDLTGNYDPNVSATATNPTKITIEADGSGTATVWLQHEQNVTVQGLPYGATYTVSESDLADYTESYKINGGAKTPGNSASGTLDADTTAAFENNKDTSVPTGIYDSITPALCLLLLAGALGGVLFLLRRRKSY